MAEFNSKDQFISDHDDFSLLETVRYENGTYSNFYSNGIDVVVIDYDICKVVDNQLFSYMLITDKQNNYIYKYNHLYRFLGYKKEEVDYYLFHNEPTSNNELVNVANREDLADSSILESSFEDSFLNVYGNNALNYLKREYSICDENGRNYFLDFLVVTKEGKIAVEENGVTYHHPQIIGVERYKNQLHKQNTCALWNIKLYRFSSEDCAFENRIEDDIRRFFGSDPSNFIDNGIKVDRKFELYEHQNISLRDIKAKRDLGLKAFLILLPTASGKSMIALEDIKDLSNGKDNFRVLILAPSINIANDWTVRVKQSLSDLYFNKQIGIKTYAYMAKHYNDFDSNYYQYIVADEAHHCVAPVYKRVIQYFNPEFLLGLTATDERLDQKKLEIVFGTYNTSLSLKDAMQKGIIAKANVYRIETNIDLSSVRFNGKDYVNADLEKRIRVTSRNELIVDVLSLYFDSGEDSKRQGIIFCVNVSHTIEMAKLLNKHGISASSYTSKSKNANQVMEDFKAKKIRFLCACNMISEGWDYPELGILVMARPTLSKVLYLQQIGRGLRKTDSKKNVFVIDVVDEYGAMTKAINMHAIFNNPYYVKFGDITKMDYKPGEFIIIDNIKEKIEKISEVDIENFDEKYGDYLSQEQVAREYFVSTGTVTNWIKKKKIVPTVKYKFGNKDIYLFSPEDVSKYKTVLNIKEHNDETIKDDFFDFLEERDYTLSYKMPFFLGFIKHKNEIGDANINDILDYYIKFYKERLDRGLKVDKPSCPYNEATLNDRKYIQDNMLANPFEKFERKRFLYYSKDLGFISMNHALFSKLNNYDWQRIEDQLNKDLDNYYASL